MSVNPPTVAVTLGSVVVPQSDVITLSVHLGATKEVSSFELVLQNWNSKYSPNGAYPIVIGQLGSIRLGRGVNTSALISVKIETLKYDSSPTESYVHVSGRCWGEKLFRKVVTKTYQNTKGEDIVKDLLDNFVGLTHSRNSTELVETTDTTFTRLEYQDTPVMDILKFVASSSDKGGVIGFDFRIAPDGNFEFFPTNSKTSPVDLSEKIEESHYKKDISRVRNKMTIYGAADKSIPPNKDEYTEALTSSDGAWSSNTGTATLDSTVRAFGSASIQGNFNNQYYGDLLFTLADGKEINADLYPVLSFWVNCEAVFSGSVRVGLYDANNHAASANTRINANNEFAQVQLKVGIKNADCWVVESGFDWEQIKVVRVFCDFLDIAQGNFWIDGLFFGGRRYSSTQEDGVSQNMYGLRELVDTDEELYSDNECLLRARALLAQLKDPAEALTVNSGVIDFGVLPILAADKIHVALPNENVDSDFRVVSVEYSVDAKSQDLEVTLELGRETPLLADWVYALRAKVSQINRYKIAK